MTEDFTRNIMLENDRVLLRPLAMTDMDILMNFSLNEPDLWTYSLTPASGIENLERYLSKAIYDRKEGKSYPFLVIDKATNEVAGSTRFYDYNALYKTVQLGYTWYGKKFQGTGLNKHCKYLLLNHAFESWQLERVEFRADATNKRSIAAMKSIGCIEEGILRSNCSSPNGRRDSIVLSILKNEWQEGVKQLLEGKLQ
jgi:RimJ/RimL family protein N-acetyltransferase